jgi:hypothetical protein
VGRGRTVPLRNGKVPKASKTEPWDGKDGMVSNSASRLDRLSSISYWNDNRNRHLSMDIMVYPFST